MKYSLNLGKVFGIKLQVHWSFLLLILWLVYAGASAGNHAIDIIWNIAFVMTIFACVVLHELGHSLTARKYGIPTKQITLLPIGGVASLERIPEDPKQELFVAAAGPAVNVAIALLLYPFVNFAKFMEGAQEEYLGTINSGNFLYLLVLANLTLVVFNAIPAFPMDGGRILRAILAFKMNRVKATKIASVTGQIFAVAFFFLGLYYNPFLVLIAIFVFFGARNEYMAVQNMAMLKGYQVQDAMSTQFITLSPQNTVEDALSRFLASSEEFLVVEQEGDVYGIVSRKQLKDYLKEQGDRQKPVTDIMSKEFQVLDIESELSDVMDYFYKNKTAFFPVMQNNKLSGVISMNKVHDFVMLKSSLQYS